VSLFDGLLPVGGDRAHSCSAGRRAAGVAANGDRESKSVVVVVSWCRRAAEGGSAAGAVRAAAAIECKA
jgi:hypothetical protein